MGNPIVLSKNRGNSLGRGVGQFRGARVLKGLGGDNPQEVWRVWPWGGGPAWSCHPPSGQQGSVWGAGGGGGVR